jgi:hypothetical protein
MLSQTSTRSSPNGPKENPYSSKEKDVGATRRIFTHIRTHVSTLDRNHRKTLAERSIGSIWKYPVRIKIKGGHWSQKISDVILEI